MKCPEFEDRLQNLLDQRLVPERDELLTAHAHSCVTCREVLRAQDALFDALPRLRVQPRAAWEKSVADDVVAAMLSESQPQHRAKRSRSFWDVRWLSVGLVGLAAAVLLAFSPAWRVMTNPPARDKNPQAQFETEPGKKKRQQLAITEPKKKVRLETPRPLPPIVPDNNPDSSGNSDLLAEYQLALQQFMATLPENVELNQFEEFSPGIRPLRSTIGLAIDTLRRTLPGHREMRTQQAPAGARWNWERTPWA